MTHPDVDHEPVLLEEAIEQLVVRADGIYLDATVGGGGHALEVAKRLQGGCLIGLDVDPDALGRARERLRGARNRVTLIRADYVDLERALDGLGIEELDGALFDLGLSSLQLADPARGFSFRRDGPLDMRYDPTQRLTAREIVNEWDESELTRILREYGEERWAARIAREIVRTRRREPLETTVQLAALIEETVPKPAQRGHHRGRDVHPATRTFQALRIAVNDELAHVKKGLEAAFHRLRGGGRLVVITFHSLEDRIVKRFMQERAQGCICPPKLPVCRCGRTSEAEIVANVTPSAQEIERNPRARSARLRALKGR